MNKQNTHTTELREDLPYTRLIQFRILAPILPEEVREITECTKFSLDIQRLVLFPAVNVTKDVRMASSIASLRRYICKMLEGVNLLSKA